MLFNPKNLAHSEQGGVGRKKGTGFHHLKGNFCPRSLRFPSEALSGKAEALSASPLLHGSCGISPLPLTSQKARPFQLLPFCPLALVWV